MIKKVIVYLLCGFALLLPCRLRIMYSEIIAWLLQGFYSIYYFTMKKVLTEIKNDKK